MNLRIRRFLSRSVRAPAFWVLCCFGTLTLVANMPHMATLPGSGAAMASDRPSLTEMNQEKALLREGTLINGSQGKFQVIKERIVFVDEGTGKTYICLENLMLQRIESFLSEDEDRRQRWQVHGKLSEFGDENYLWIDRATRAR